MDDKFELEFKIKVEKNLAEAIAYKLMFDKRFRFVHAENKTDRYYQGTVYQVPEMIRLRHSEIDTPIGYSLPSQQSVIDDFFNKDAEPRTKDTKNYLTIKTKKVEDGNEKNVERETEITDPSVLEYLFSILRFTQSFEKSKNSLFFVYAGGPVKGVVPIIHIELVKVAGKYYFEIESVNTAKEDIAKINLTMEDVAREYGLEPMNKDPRSWQEIMEEELI